MDNRRYPRYPTDLMVDIHTDGGQDMQARVRNVSFSGLELACDRWVADQLLPAGHQVLPGRAIEVRLTLHLDEGTVASLAASGEIVDARRLSQSVYHVGINLRDFDVGAKTAFERYLQRCADKFK